MKVRFISISLFLCLVVPISTAFVWLHVQKLAVKEQMKHEILRSVDRSDLVLVKLTKQNAEVLLSWEHENEFEYQGHMYDLVEQETRNGILYLWCWADDEETDLNRKLNKLLARAANNNPQNNEQQHRLMDYLETLFCQQNISWLQPAALAADKDLFLYRSTYISRKGQPLLPPPRFLNTLPA